MRMLDEEKAPDPAPIATHLRFENELVKIWEMDLGPGEICGLHHHTRDYILYILAGGRIEVESPGMTSNRFPGRRFYELEVGARAVSYVPAGGRESARNIGDGRFREAIFEMKQPFEPGVHTSGFALTEAVAGREPEPGVLMLLETTRVRVIETTLAPGDGPSMRLDHRDSAVFVIEGSRVETTERDSAGIEHISESVRVSSMVLWQPRGIVRRIRNVGFGRYRELRVEFR